MINKFIAKLYSLFPRFAYKLEILLKYKDKYGAPLKCYCGCKDLEDCDYDYLNGFTVLEYNSKCKKCGSICGHWAYGYWCP